MLRSLKQYVIRKLREPTEKQLDRDIEWVCNSFGFITTRDQDKTAFRILKALIKSAKEGKGLKSKELADLLIKFVGMSDKDNQQVVIDDIKHVLRKLGEGGFD